MVKNPSCYESLLDAVEQACKMTDRNLRKVLMKKSTGAIRETLSMMNASWIDNNVISKLRQDFSSMSTMNRARLRTKGSEATTRSAYQFIHVQIWKDPLPCHRESSTK